MASNQQHEANGLQIDDVPTVASPATNNDTSQENNTQEKTRVAIPENSALPPYQKNAPVAIDVSSGPPMVTPPKLLQRDPAWVDCAFCKRMAKTRVALREEKEEPSGLMMCMVCLVCCPLLCFLPMMMGSTKSWTHTCSSCSAVIAVRGENGQIEVKEPMPSKLVPSKFGAAANRNSVGA